jgi:hypothetical protein
MIIGMGCKIQDLARSLGVAKKDLSSGDRSDPRENAEDGLGENRFTRAAFSDKGDRLAGRDLETDAAHGLDDALGGTEIDDQVIDLKERGGASAHAACPFDRLDEAKR